MNIFKRKPKKLYKLTFKEWSLMCEKYFYYYYNIKAKTANKAIEYWYKKYTGTYYSRYELQNVEVIDWKEENES